MHPFILPKPLGVIFSVLPQYPHSFAFCQALNLALGTTLRSDALQPLHGKVICLHISDALISLHFTLDKSGMTARHAQGNPDLTITAQAYDFLQLALRKEDPDTLFFSRRLLIEGDTELGLLAKNTLDAMELPSFDWHMLMPATILHRLKEKITSSRAP